MALPVTSHTIIDEEKQEQNCSMRGGGGEELKTKGNYRKGRGNDLTNQDTSPQYMRRVSTAGVVITTGSITGWQWKGSV